MRIAFFSDVHGNIAALEAVLEDIGRAGVDGMACGGDVAAFGPRPVEVVQRLRGVEGLMMIRGNTDRWLEIVRDRPLGPYDEKVLEKVRPALAWTIEKLPDPFVAMLANLPVTGSMEVGGVGIHLEHASPGSDWVGIEPGMGDDEVAGLFEGFALDGFVCGHTHEPFTRRVGSVLVVNDGSVGFPYDGVPMPSWALVTIEGGRVEAEIRRVEYEREAVVRDIADTGMVWGDVMRRRLETATM